MKNLTTLFKHTNKIIIQNWLPLEIKNDWSNQLQNIINKFLYINF